MSRASVIRSLRSAVAIVTALSLVALACLEVASSATPTWSGHWRAYPYGLFGDPTFTLEQRESSVSGAFRFQMGAERPVTFGPCLTGRGGTIRGTVQGRILTAVMVWPAQGGHPKTKIRLTATISPSGREIFAMPALVLSGECKNVWFTFQAKRIR